MLQTMTQFCLLHLVPAMQVVNILFSAAKSMQKILADDTSLCVKQQQLILVTSSNEPMENCVAPGLDKFQSIIRSCIVFGQSRHE